MITFAGIEYPKKLWSLPSGSLAKRLAEFKLHKEPVTSGYYQDNPCPNTDGKMFYLDSDFMPGLRWSYCDEVDGARIDHKGWFTDDFCAEAVRGIVFRLPHGKGFLAAWSLGESMIGEVEYYIYEDEVTAAYAANKEAESQAELAREQYEASQLEEVA